MKMGNKHIYIISAAIIILLTGCFGVNSNFRITRNIILSGIDANIEKDVEFGAGSIFISLASTFVKFADTDEPVDELLSNISKIQVGIYNFNYENNYKPDYNLLCSLTNKMSDLNWKYIVRSIDNNELNAVFIRPEKFDEMFVAAVSGNEIILAHIEGNLDKIIEIAVRDHGLEFETVQN